MSKTFTPDGKSSGILTSSPFKLSPITLGSLSETGTLFGAVALHPAAIKKSAKERIISHLLSSVGTQPWS